METEDAEIFTSGEQQDWGLSVSQGWLSFSGLGDEAEAAREGREGFWTCAGERYWT